MPNLDGTGPQGRGPRTGWGRGFCSSGIGKVVGKKSVIMSLVSLAVPAVTAVIADARKPDGVTRRLYSAVKVRLTGPSKDRELSGSQVELDKEKEV